MYLVFITRSSDWGEGDELKYGGNLMAIKAPRSIIRASVMNLMKA